MTASEQAAIVERGVLRARQVAAAFRASARVIHVLRVMINSDKEVNDLLVGREALERKFEKLATCEPGSYDFEVAVSEAEAELRKLDGKIMQADAAVPMAWFRTHFTASKFTSEALADYAAMLGRFAGDEAARLDRAQLLLTRLLISYLGGKAANLKGANLRSLLAEALPPSTLDDETRTRAVTFFSEATARIEGFASLDELTKSSFFLDVRGFKLALRKGVLDPEVMAGAIELNQRTTEAVDRLARTDAPVGVDIETHMKEVDARIRAVFAAIRVDDSAEVEAFEKRLKKAAGAGLITIFPSFRPLIVYRWTTIVLSVATAIALVFQLRAEKPIGELSLNETLSISQLLVTATVQPPSAPRLLVGRIDKRRWSMLTAPQRRDAAGELMKRLEGLGIEAATVMMEDQVVIQLEHGTLLIVQ